MDAKKEAKKKRKREAEEFALQRAKEWDRKMHPPSQPKSTSKRRIVTSKSSKKTRTRKTKENSDRSATTRITSDENKRSKSAAKVQVTAAKVARKVDTNITIEHGTAFVNDDEYFSCNEIVVPAKKKRKTKEPSCCSIDENPPSPVSLSGHQAHQANSIFEPVLDHDPRDDPPAREAGTTQRITSDTIRATQSAQFIPLVQETIQTPPRSKPVHKAPFGSPVPRNSVQHANMLAAPPHPIRLRDPPSILLAPNPPVQQQEQVVVLDEMRRCDAISEMTHEPFHDEKRSFWKTIVGALLLLVFSSFLVVYREQVLTFINVPNTVCFQDTIPTCNAVNAIVPSHCIGVSDRVPCPGVCEDGKLVSCGHRAQAKGDKCELDQTASDFAKSLNARLIAATISCPYASSACDHPSFVKFEEDRPLFDFATFAHKVDEKVDSKDPNILHIANKYLDLLFLVESVDGKVVFGMHPSIPLPQSMAKKTISAFKYVLVSFVSACYTTYLEYPLVSVGASVLFALYCWWKSIVAKQIRLENLVVTYRKRALDELYKSGGRETSSECILHRIIWNDFPSSQRKRDDFTANVWVHVVNDVQKDSRVIKNVVRENGRIVAVRWQWADQHSP